MFTKTLKSTAMINILYICEYWYVTNDNINNNNNTINVSIDIKYDVDSESVHVIMCTLIDFFNYKYWVQCGIKQKIIHIYLILSYGQLVFHV